METVTHFIFLGSKITADGDCSHELRHLLLGRKAVSNLDSILKSRGITLLTRVYTIKGMVFQVVMYGCESWTIRKAELRRADAFECGVGEDSWVLWTARSIHSILKEISPEYSLEQLMLKLKLQSFGPLMRRTESLEKTDDGKDWRQEEKGTTEDEMVGWHHWLGGHEFEQTPGVGDGQGSMACCSPWGRKDPIRTEELNWTEWLEQRERNWAERNHCTWRCKRVWRKGGQAWRKKGREKWKFWIIREVGEKASLWGTDGSERQDGSQGRSREEDRHSRRAEGKRKGDRERNRETDKPNKVETSCVQVVEGTRSRRVLNWLDKELRCDTLIFSFTV